MEILDDLQRIAEIDKENMLEIEENFYEQLRHAQEILEEVDLNKIKMRTFNGICFLGMGGSGFAGGLIKDLVKNDIGIPIDVVKGYNLPGYVDDNWLSVSISYSGNTEETILATREAIDRGSEVIFVASGGKLKEMAIRYNKCFVEIPGGFQPRAAIGYLFFPTLLILNYLGFISIPEKDIEECLGLIKEKCSLYSRTRKVSENKAKYLATRICDKLPVVYGSEGFLSSVAYRWKCEINENAKTPCFWAEFPELNHNETVGWQRLKDITLNLALIILREKDEGERIKTRAEVTKNLIKESLGEIIEVWVDGKSKLARAIDALYLGDITSVYLALVNGIDPTPVDKIGVLKNELAKLGPILRE